MYILHGDEFDGAVRSFPILYSLGDFSYKILIKINNLQNKLRRLLKFREWSLAHWIKTKVKDIVKFVSNFEFLVVEKAKEKNCQIILAGHIHVPADKNIDGIRYLNCGTWCELTSFVIEYEDGKIESVIL
jgi:UDP-2,3-diacylglucosamine pyrophosphatase LpxH